MVADHVSPVVPIDGFTGEKHLDYNWNELIQRLYCEADGFQALCKECHKEFKTKEESSIRKKNKNMKTKYPLTYTSWVNMIYRCNNPKATGFDRYGGRGISVCDRWKDIENFIKDMGERPSPIHSIDRVNNDGHYEPGNCRWATPKEQCRNLSNNSLLTWGEETCCVSEWAERLSMKPNTLTYRIRRGWSTGEALGFEKRERPTIDRKVSNDEIIELHEAGLNQVEIGKELNLDSSVISRRFKEMGLRPTNKQSLLRKERTQRAAEMRRMGCTLDYIAEVLGCSISSVGNYIKTAKLKSADERALRKVDNGGKITN